MVMLMMTHEDEVISFGPCSDKEWVEILPILKASQPPSMKNRDIEHYFIRDFHREALDKSREDVKIKEIYARMEARRMAELNGERSDGVPVHETEAEPEEEEEEETSEPAGGPAEEAAACPKPPKAKKGLKWKPEQEIAEYPLRILRGATGVVFHQTSSFVFCAFFDDEKRADSVAAFQYEDIVQDSELGIKLGPDVNLRFQAITFDAERLLDEIVQCDVAFDYVAYEVKFKGEKRF